MGLRNMPALPLRWLQRRQRSPAVRAPAGKVCHAGEGGTQGAHPGNLCMVCRVAGAISAAASSRGPAARPALPVSDMRHGLASLMWAQVLILACFTLQDPNVMRGGWWWWAGPGSMQHATFSTSLLPVTQHAAHEQSGQQQLCSAPPNTAAMSDPADPVTPADSLTGCSMSPKASLEPSPELCRSSRSASGLRGLTEDWAARQCSTRRSQVPAQQMSVASLATHIMHLHTMLSTGRIHLRKTTCREYVQILGVEPFLANTLPVVLCRSFLWLFVNLLQALCTQHWASTYLNTCSLRQAYLQLMIAFRCGCSSTTHPCAATTRSCCFPGHTY